jgi:hypothetical protein
MLMLAICCIVLYFCGMPYRSERFEVGELTALGEVFRRVDNDAKPFDIDFEVMSGARHRRRVSPTTVAELGHEPDYLLQVVLGMHDETGYLAVGSARKYFEISGRKIEEITDGLDAHGAEDVEVYHDQGGLNGWDSATTKEYPFGTGKFETEMLAVFPPWTKVSWHQAGKSCLFFCGVDLPPRIGVEIDTRRALSPSG